MATDEKGTGGRTGRQAAGGPWSGERIAAGGRAMRHMAMERRAARRRRPWNRRDSARARGRGERRGRKGGSLAPAMALLLAPFLLFPAPLSLALRCRPMVFILVHPCLRFPQDVFHPRSSLQNYSMTKYVNASTYLKAYMYVITVKYSDFVFVIAFTMFILD